jgi:Zn-dependent peptidase ImmA (M78 family)
MFREINLKSEVIKGLIGMSGFDKEEISKKSKISLKSLDEGKLTIPQLKRLAEVLKRPIAAFFSDEIPSLPTAPDYRLNREKRINPEIFMAQRRLIYLLEKLKEMGIEKSSIPKIEPNISHFQLAGEFRNYLGIEVIKNQKPNVTLSKYKEIIEHSLKFLIVEYPLKPKKKKETDDVRAFSIYYSEIGGIVLNETDHPSVKLFSLFHEICHLLKRNSGICSLDYEVEKEYEEESFCNKFAAEFLVPSYDIEKRLQTYSIPEETILETVSKLSKLYSVSKQVILLRLLYLNHISTEKYYSLRAQLEEREIKQQFGRRNWEEVFKNRVGNLTIKEVKKGLQENKLSFYEALNIFDVKTKYAEKFLYE